MGYYTYFQGGLEIVPAIALPTPTEAGYNNEKAYFDYFTMDVKEGDEDVQLVNGVITVVGKSPGSIDVGLLYEESIKGYNFEEQVNALVDWAKAAGATVNGTITCDGEEDRDIHRYRIENNVIFHEAPQLVWPNGDVENI